MTFERSNNNQFDLGGGRQEALAKLQRPESCKYLRHINFEIEDALNV